ncbi:MAG: hypothetical protein L3J12_04205 [Spirochaetales bacterium]|nr:hypothetical protein [Spirochaetales bacterium]
MIHLELIVIFFHIKGGTIDSGNIPYITAKDQSIFAVLYLILFKTIFSCIAGITLRNLFQKIASPEIFFFSLAILSLSFTAVRSLLTIENIINYPIYFPETITRTVYFGKIITVLSLFTSGLFSTGTTFKKQESFLILIVLIAIVLSSAIPIDLLETDVTLLMGSGSEYGINIVFIILQILAVWNFLAGGVKNNNHDYLFLAAGVGMVALGNEMLFSLIPGWISIAALLLLSGGTYLFGYKIHKIYQWT